ncbi:hypothetical protein RB195_026335 [Necator americanus]|uniref:Uncharacterized protein n=1 Tax=Necator americanus TaxID=51031 RepID=A0ABR1EWK1_NECAM
MGNIDDEYERLVEHSHNRTRNTNSVRTAKRYLFPEIIGLVRQCVAARSADNHEFRPEFARSCREAIKEEFEERRPAVFAEAAEEAKGIRYPRRNFAHPKTKMTSLWNPDGTTTASRRMETIYDFYPDLFDSIVHLLLHHLRKDRHVIPESSFRCWTCDHDHHAKNRTLSCLHRVKLKHLKNLTPVLINTVARLFTSYLSERRIPKPWKISNTVLFYNSGDLYDIGNYRLICSLTAVLELFTRVILNRIERTLDEGQL